jgi:uncharacterized protein YndB with AHSA1/START domain
MTNQAKSGRTIETVVDMAATPDAVWRALTDPAELTRWFPLEAHVSPGAGGRVRWSWGEPIVSEATIEAWEPGRRLLLVEQTSLGEHVTPEEGRSTPGRVMEFTLEAREGRTVLRLVHSGFGEGADWENELFDGVLRGWTFELRALRHYLEAHPGEHRQVAWVHVPFRGSVEEAWNTLMSPRAFLAAGSLANLKEGDRYRIGAATGDVFEGTVVVHIPGKQFSGTVANMNDALLRVELEYVARNRDVTVWLSAYGLPEADVRAFHDRWQGAINSQFTLSSSGR